VGFGLALAIFAGTPIREGRHHRRGIVTLLCFMRSLWKPVALSARHDDVQTGYSAVSNHMQLKDALVQMHHRNRDVGQWQMLACCAVAEFA